jgi:hypothetical protein
MVEKAGIFDEGDTHPVVKRFLVMKMDKRVRRDTQNVVNPNMG